MATGYLPIGSCSRRVPQAGAAVPRTGNVPGADLEALPSKDTARGGGGQTHTQEEARLKRRVQTLQRRGIGVICGSHSWHTIPGHGSESGECMFCPGAPVGFLAYPWAIYISPGPSAALGYHMSRGCVWRTLRGCWEKRVPSGTVMGGSNKGWGVGRDKAPSGCTHLALRPRWPSFRPAEACDLIDRQLPHPHPEQERKRPAWSEETPAGWNWGDRTPPAPSLWEV